MHTLAIYLILVLLTISSVYLAWMYAPTIYVKPFSTSAVPSYGGLLLDREYGEKILNKIYGVSINDIVIPYKYLYIIAPLDVVGVYMNGVLRLKNEGNWTEIRNRFFSEYGKGCRDCYLAVSPNLEDIIIIGAMKELPLTHDPRVDARPPLILYWNNSLVKEFKWVMVLPLSITDLDPEAVSFYIELRLTRENYTKEGLINEFNSIIEEDRVIIERNKDKPWILYEGPRIPGKITYINDWPAIITPQHEICNIVEEPSPIKQCLIYPTQIGTGLNGVWIVVQTYLGDDRAIEQMEMVLKSIGGGG